MNYNPPRATFCKVLSDKIKYFPIHLGKGESNLYLTVIAVSKHVLMPVLKNNWYIDRGKYPHIYFIQGECTFCEQCVDSLAKQYGSEPWIH